MPTIDGIEKKRGRGRPSKEATPVLVRIPHDELSEIDSWASRQGAFATRPAAIRQLTKLGLAADRQARAKVRTDAADERSQDAAKARADYATAQGAEAAKTERLRQVRLAKEDHDRRAAAGNPPPAAMTEKTRKKLAAEKPLAPDRAESRNASAARAKELAVGAVRKELAKVDVSLNEKITRTKKLVKRPAGLERQAPTDRIK